MGEVEILIETLEDCKEGVELLAVEFKSGDKESQGGILERMRDNLDEMNQMFKTLEINTGKQDDTYIKWKKEKIRLSEVYNTLEKSYVNGVGDDIMFENEHDMVVYNQNQKLKASTKKMNEAFEFGVQTNEEIGRINDKLRGVKIKRMRIFSWDSKMQME